MNTNFEISHDQEGVYDYTNNKKLSFSRFASPEETKKSLYQIAVDNTNPEKGGIPLFADQNAVYIEGDDVHSMVFGITGAMKSRLIAMPALRMLAMAGESFIANDPKGELYQKTFPLLDDREYKIIVINLRDPLRSNTWNPLQIPYMQYRNGQKDKATESIIDMSNCITNAGDGNVSYWDNSGASLLTGLIMLLFEYAGEKEIHFKSLRALRAQAFKVEEGGIPYIQSNFLQHVDKSSFLYALLAGTVDVCHDTRSCIISIFDQAMMTFFCQDNLINMLSGSDFEIGGIGKTKTAVFLITPYENTVYNKLISIFVKQCYTELLRVAEQYPDKKLPVRVNFIMDEFANLPAITDFSTMVTAARSRNIRFNLFVQSKKQLSRRYGADADTIQSNCENWVLLYSRETALLDEIIGLSGKKNSEEPLITASFLQTLDKKLGEAYILNKRLYPYVANLWDIDKYPKIAQEEKTVQYPANDCKAEAVFDLELCSFNMRTPQRELISEPISSSSPLPDNPLEEADNELEEEDTEVIEEEPLSKVTLERYGSSVGCGWHGLLAHIFEEINLYNNENKGYEIEIDQIKEKFGTLSFYTSRCPDYIKGMISLAEEESGHICEICGARGETVLINGWYTTLCHHHAKAKKAAGYDSNLLLKLYRKFMETYEYHKWSRTYNPAFKRLLKKNWFITKNKVNGKLRIVKLERESQRTNFYVKTEKEFKKHRLYVQWSDTKEKTLLDGYWHVKEGNTKESYGMLERQTAEKEAVSKIYSSWGKNHNMELIRMVSFKEGLAFTQCSAQENSDDYWNFVKEYLLKHNIKMTGTEHAKYGVPLIENNGTVYAFILSSSDWGKLMAETFDPDNKDKFAYKKWAWKRPKGEVSWVNPDFQ
ncbi:MAG: type IV secretory system conjugative DNA transfer family protein [Treponema sp.]|jgi:type IV secretion system protein VirD4|nr:type IV secretory system conjugative DNA transfer family protein [Treponema sp.]